MKKLLLFLLIAVAACLTAFYAYSDKMNKSELPANIGLISIQPSNFISPTPEKEVLAVPSPEKPLEIEGLVELVELDGTFVIDQKYATADNFTGEVIYSEAKLLINKDTAKKLIEVNNEFKKLGYGIKVFDAYRPYSAQKVLWDAALDKSYVADPKKGSNHNRGTAVDITLVDSAGKELEMPSGYDELSKRAHLDFNDCSKAAINNRELLGKIMVKHGFKRISTEWWHFDDINAKNYKILDIAFEEFP